MKELETKPLDYHDETFQSIEKELNETRSKNQISILEDGNEVFPAMRDAIEQAAESIFFLTYVYWSGDVPDQFCNLLCRKAEEGVPCYLLLDAHGSFDMDRERLVQLSNAGVVVCRYNPFDIKTPLEYQHRTHRKILVCDGEVGFVGGVGIGDEWSDAFDEDRRWHDYHFRVEGPVVDALSRGFIKNWNHSRSVPFQGDKVTLALQSNYIIQEVENGAETIPLASYPHQKESEAFEVYETLVSRARKSVDILSAYLIPNERILTLFEKAVDRNVKVRIVMPGRRNDSWVAESLARDRWGDFLDLGIELYLYEVAMCHAKAMIIDDEIVSIGSINFDMVSLCLNDEFNLIVKDRTFAAAMKEKFENDLAISRRLTREDYDQRGLWKRTKEKVAASIPLPVWTENCDY